MLQLITILNRCHRFRGFVYQRARFGPDHQSIEVTVRPRKRESCLMQDEPERLLCFSYKMSLKERLRMLGFDRQRANGTKVEPGADPGVSASQR